MYSKAGAEAYFMAEKQAALFVLILGVAGVVAAVLLYFFGGKVLLKGMAIPITVIAILQIIVGFTVYQRSDAQRKDIVYKMDMNPQAIQQQELPRMQKVMKAFTYYRIIEIVLLVAGLYMFFAWRNQPEKGLLAGIGLGLMLQCIIMLGFDYVAEKRGAAYLRELQHQA